MIALPLPLPDEAERAAEAALRHVWRAIELGRGRTLSITSGHRTLDVELRDSGWLQSTLVQLLLQQSGIGELTVPALFKL